MCEVSLFDNLQAVNYYITSLKQMVTFDAINPFCTQNYLQMWSLLQVVLICSVFVPWRPRQYLLWFFCFAEGKWNRVTMLCHPYSCFSRRGVIVIEISSGQMTSALASTIKGKLQRKTKSWKRLNCLWRVGGAHSLALEEGMRQGAC